MNAPDENFPDGVDAILSCSLLNDAEREVVASFLAVTEMASKTAKLALRYSIGRPLTAYQSLLETYHSLVIAEHRLQDRLEQILRSALGRKP